MASRLYLETSVISYLSSQPSRDLIVAANQQITREWWDTPRPDIELYISQLVIMEASAGDTAAAEQRRQLIDEIPSLTLSEAAVALAERLVRERVVPEQAVEDALHIAIATVNGMDYLVTWNFRHIANAAVRSKIERVCRLAGFEPPVICTPQELLGEE